jgi:hypothetical protein
MREKWQMFFPSFRPRCFEEVDAKYQRKQQIISRGIININCVSRARRLKDPKHFAILFCTKILATFKEARAHAPENEDGRQWRASNKQTSRGGAAGVGRLGETTAVECENIAGGGGRVQTYDLAFLFRGSAISITREEALPYAYASRR